MTAFDTACAKLEFERVKQRIIRYAAADPGRDVLQSLEISTSLDGIRREVAKVSEAKLLLEEEGDLPLAGIHPVRAALQKSAVEGSSLLPRELVQISSVARASRVLRSFLAKRKERAPLLWEMGEHLSAEKVLEYNIEQAVDDTGAVRDGASRELQAVRRAIADRYDQLKKRLEGILRTVSDQGFSQDDIITTREGRMVIPVKSEHKNRVHGFIHSASSSGATVFIEPSETLELNNDIRSLQFQEQREVDRILHALTLQVRDSREALQESLGILAGVDALSAKAKYSLEILGVEPTLADRGPLKLVRARHPLLLANHGYDKTVPLDLQVGGEYRTLVISGPNAGGKSVALKCVGLLVLMAQAGLHIPAGEDSVVRIFRRCFVDIGDEQSIENDLSTFSSHLENLKAIVEGADGESLVLIDEIGSGTDPGEGGAIAAAVLEWLTRRGACTVATTHQGSLKVFAHQTEGVENGAMEFDQATLIPTYRFHAGIPGSSYALDMAERIGLDGGMMKRARAYLGEEKTKLEALIGELETTAQDYRRQLQEVLAEKARLDDMVGQYETRIASLSGELKELKRSALDEARRIVEQANAVIERTVREIREKEAGRESIKTARQEVSDMKQEIDEQQKQVEPGPAAAAGQLTAGSTVRLTEGGDTGEILSVAPDGRTAVVVFGSMKMRVPLSDLQESRARPTRQGPAAAPPEKPGQVLHDLDLRGMTGDEAIPLIDKFLDDALLAGLHRVDIIHGKGTGALRKKVTDFLSHHPGVKAFRLGEWNEGGTGATVVELAEH